MNRCGGRMAPADYRRGDEKMSLRTFLSRWLWQSDTWRTQRVRTGGGRLRRRSIFAAAALVVFACALAISGVATALAATTLTATSHVATAPAAPSAAPGQPNFGPNVYIFNPGMPQSEIQKTVDTVANQQVSNQFGTQRYALLFEPGTYGSTTNPLNFQIGYYTAVAGLGLSPNDVVINGSIYVHNQCLGPNNTNCIALVNFWRSLSNLTCNVTAP